MIVVWLPKARQTLADITTFIAKDNPAAAQEMASLILEKVRLLTHHPNIGRPGRVTGTRELVLPGTPFLVSYLIRGSQIVILRVLHGKQKWP